MQTENNSAQFDESSIAATYAALSVLKTLGDDHSRVNKKAIVQMLRKLQSSSGWYRRTSLLVFPLRFNNMKLFLDQTRLGAGYAVCLLRLRDFLLAG